MVNLDPEADFMFSPVVFVDCRQNILGNNESLLGIGR